MTENGIGRYINGYTTQEGMEGSICQADDVFMMAISITNIDEVSISDLVEIVGTFMAKFLLAPFPFLK